MELKRFEKPLAVEELVFQVNPELVDKWIELDHEVWTKGLAEWPGFAGKEVWLNKDVPGEVTTIIYWTDYGLWQAIDVNWLIETDKKLLDIIGENNVQLIREGHKNNQKFKVCEYK